MSIRRVGFFADVLHQFNDYKLQTNYSVRNRCVIEVFGGVCVCCPLVFEFSADIGGFVIGLGQISFFFSLYFTKFIVVTMSFMHF